MTPESKRQLVELFAQLAVILVLAAGVWQCMGPPPVCTCVSK